LQTPVATDLRLVFAILHANLHLGRVGDQAVNIAKIFQATRVAEFLWLGEVEVKQGAGTCGTPDCAVGARHTDSLSPAGLMGVH
jgi:hypothetical protein